MLKSKYKSLAEWRQLNIHAYRVAYYQNLLPKICKICGWEKPFVWTKELCIQDAKKYHTRNEWRINRGGPYGAARRNKWLSECCEHMIECQKPNRYWSKERCIKEGMKYTSVGEWQTRGGGSYYAALKNKWLPECTKHMVSDRKPMGYWIKELCIEEAKKYLTKSEWRINGKSSYHVACRNKWLSECCEHMIEINNRKGYWNKERCIEEAKKYTTNNQWVKNGKGSYHAAMKNNWLPEINKFCYYRK